MAGTLLFQRIAPSYRIPVFRRLHEELGIILCHSVVTIGGVSSYHEAIDFKNEVLPGKFFLGRKNLFTQTVLPVLRKHRPSVIICEYAFGNITFWKLLLLRPVFGYKLIGWSHGIKNRDMVLEVKSSHFRLTGYILRKLDAILLYSTGRKAVLIDQVHSIDHKCFVANNTLDTAAYLSVSEKMSMKNREEVKQAVGLHCDFTICYLGRLRNAKRIDLILAAWEGLRQRYNVGLVLIGDGEEAKSLEQYGDVDGFLAPGAIHDIEESGKYLHASDVMLMPGYVGLSIVHAFAFGLPMITCRSTKTGPFHSPEVEYLRDGENGFFCDSTAESLASCIEKLILDPALLTRMKQNARETVENEANIDRMIAGFRDAINYVTKREN